MYDSAPRLCPTWPKRSTWQSFTPKLSYLKVHLIPCGSRAFCSHSKRRKRTDRFRPPQIEPSSLCLKKKEKNSARSNGQTAPRLKRSWSCSWRSQFRQVGHARAPCGKNGTSYIGRHGNGGGWIGISWYTIGDGRCVGGVCNQKMAVIFVICIFSFTMPSPLGLLFIDRKN